MIYYYINILYMDEKTEIMTNLGKIIIMIGNLKSHDEKKLKTINKKVNNLHSILKKKKKKTIKKSRKSINTPTGQPIALPSYMQDEPEYLPSEPGLGFSSDIKYKETPYDSSITSTYGQPEDLPSEPDNIQNEPEDLPSEPSYLPSELGLGFSPDIKKTPYESSITSTYGQPIHISSSL